MSIANTVVLDLMLLCYSIAPFEEFFFRVMALMNSGFCGLYCCLELLICEYNLLCIQLRQEIKAPACLAAKTFIIKSYFSIFFFDPTEPLQPLQFSNYPHFVFFFYQGFLSRPFTNHRTAGEGGGHFFSFPQYHFHLLQRHLDISQAITPEHSPLHIGSSQTRTRNLWFPSGSC